MQVKDYDNLKMKMEAYYSLERKSAEAFIESNALDESVISFPECGNVISLKDLNERGFIATDTALECAIAAGSPLKNLQDVHSFLEQRPDLRSHFVPLHSPTFDLRFRVNSGFTLDLSILPNQEQCTLDISSLIQNPTDYFKGELECGVHVVFGSAGQGKSVFCKELAKKFDIPRFAVFESEADSAITDKEISCTIREALSHKVAILDSLRFIGMQATGFPATDKGINSGIFVFTQWLSIVARRAKCVLFVVISTERAESYVQQLYKDYILGAAESAYFMKGHGEGEAIFRNKPRSEWQPFQFKNEANWSFNVVESDADFEASLEQLYALHGSAKLNV